jgi:predicted translin family RNA/ssDNA-binding protein
MARWNYNLRTNGAQLKDLIYQDDSSQHNCIAIIEQMILCCKWLQTKLTEEDKDDYEWDLEEMIQDCEDTKCYLDEFDEDSNEDNINDILEKFYDLMDEMRVWIGV